MRRESSRPASQRSAGHALRGWQRVIPKGMIHRGVFFLDSALESLAELQPEGPCVRDARLARLEAVLLLAREPLSSRRLAQFSRLADGTEARTLIRVLNRYYEEQATAFRVEEVAGGFQLFARPQFGTWLRRLYQSPVSVRLSNPALETLAVVAYRQPVLRAQIESIRGVQSGELLRQLMERDLVRIVGRSPELGRPFQYGTTKRFLRIFGLRHLDDLPRVASLRPAAETAGSTHEEQAPGVAGELDTLTICQRQEESDVRISAFQELSATELLDAPEMIREDEVGPAVFAAKDEDEDEEDDEDDEDDDDEEDDDYEDDDLEEEEWEEVDDEEEEEDDEEFDDEDDDWEDDDEDDDDWDDDEEEDWEEGDEK